MTTSSISVKDKIAQFELLKKAEEGDDSIDGAKKRFGWHPTQKKILEKVIDEDVRARQSWARGSIKLPKDHLEP